MPPTGVFEPTLGRKWPVGHYYADLSTGGTKNNRAWVEYKLGAAGWYLEALSELEARTGQLSRLIGEEMAIDGVVGAISSAFDAAVAGLIPAIEARRGTPGVVPPHAYSWKIAKQIALPPPQINLKCEKAVDDALRGPKASPAGWLEQLRQLRNRATHQDTLPRQIR